MKGIHKLTIVLVIVTVLIMLLYWKYGNSLVFSIKPSEFSFEADNDQQNGGHSRSSMRFHGDMAVLNCQLVKTDDYPWPYCGVSVSLTDKIFEGKDLSHFHTLRMNIDLERVDGEFSPKMRVYLRNFNPAYSEVDDEHTQKFNGVEYIPGVNSGAVDIPIKNLQVMTWWLVHNDIPVEHSAPEVSNVTKVELATGSDIYEGQYRMKIHSIEFVGSYISKERLMFGLLLFWLTLAFGYSAIEIRRSHKIILHSHFRQGHLRKLNKELKEQNIHFAELASRDALTGAMNRHAIRDWLDNHYDEVNVSGKTLSVLYLDVDHFKSINDLYGHSMGDDILREFTMVVLSSLSPSERLVRWGGEEFVVFCPGRDLKEVSQLAERVREKVAKRVWIHGDELTTSVGVATLGKERINDMLVRADEALYRAKHLGRNRVEVSR